MLTSEAEFIDAPVLMPRPLTSVQNEQAKPETPTKPKLRLLVLSDHAPEREQIKALGPSLGAISEFASSGQELIDAWARGPAQVQNTTGRATMYADMVVLGGQLPCWVVVDLMDRIKHRSQQSLPGSNAYQMPAFLLLMAAQDMDDVWLRVSKDHSDLRFDFVERPLREAEFCVRAKRLLHRELTESSTKQQFESFPEVHIDLTALNDISLGPAFFGPYEFDFQRHIVKLKGEAMRLSYREFSMSWMLFSNLGKVVSRTQLLQSLFLRKGPGRAIKNNRSLDSYVCRIRNSLKLYPENGYSLVSVYGQGYVIRTA